MRRKSLDVVVDFFHSEASEFLPQGDAKTLEQSHLHLTSQQHCRPHHLIDSGSRENSPPVACPSQRHHILQIHTTSHSQWQLRKSTISSTHPSPTTPSPPTAIPSPSPVITTSSSSINPARTSNSRTNCVDTTKPSPASTSHPAAAAS